MIRFYEKKGIISPKRNPKNNYRNYTFNDLYIIVLTKQYNNLGMDLETISNFLKDTHSNKAYENIDNFIIEMEKQIKLINSRIEFAKDTRRIFKFINDENKIDIIKRNKMYFIPKTKLPLEKYSQLFVVEGYGRAVNRIKLEKLNSIKIPIDRGLLLDIKPFNEKIYYEEYSNIIIFRNFINIPNFESVTMNDIKNFENTVNSNGYKIIDDIFLFLVSKINNEKNSYSIVCIEAIVKKV